MSLPIPEYDDLDATALAQGVRQGQVLPEELLDAAIARIDARDGALNAVIYRQFDEARERVARLPDGPFRGVPMLLKDLGAEMKGHPSTQSCRAMADWRAPQNCTLVDRLLATGVQVLGRTNTPELGIMGTTEPRWRGPTRNPWNTEHSAGGSSGGSAAAVAARMVPMAHAGDGGGSIRIPASHTGLFGLKPSRARVPSGPWVPQLWGGLVSEHVLTRSVRDAAAMLDAIAGPELGGPTVPAASRFLDSTRAALPPLKIAFTAQSLYGRALSPDAVAALHDAVALAESLGHTVEELPLPFERAPLIRHYMLEVAVGTAAGLRALGARRGRALGRGDVEPPTWLFARIGEAISGADLESAREAAHGEMRKIAAFFEEWPVLLTPTVAAPPARIGALNLSFGQEALIATLGALGNRTLLLRALDLLAVDALELTPNTMLFNQTGQPAMSVPTWWTAEGLPMGSQWIAARDREDTLFTLAAQLESARPWATRKPIVTI